ncbi:hypothetical protein [Kosakonia arachidis]|uniref:hypothetical protein n=1 Tax=Kosakonia arachidis TaxID=551989 RepID=UPI001FCB28E9|nr:hypothetical protein [Kosakonia arachidis]
MACARYPRSRRGEALFLAEHILVMSAKPGKIVEEAVLPFGCESDIETHAEHLF